MCDKKTKGLTETSLEHNAKEPRYQLSNKLMKIKQFDQTKKLNLQHAADKANNNRMAIQLNKTCSLLH